MTRREFANMTAIVAKRGAEWTQELISTGNITEEQKPEAIKRFCDTMRALLADIENP